jgi:putative ABC transport system permease protein
MAETQVTELLQERHRIRPDQANDFSIRNISEFLSAREESSQVMSMLLAAVAGVSLLVGGIGIMNIMLVSVTERTREIGLRMAIGASGRDIMTQFLIEAVSLSLIGGIIGIIFGTAGAKIIANFANWPMQIELYAPVMAFGFAAFIGIFFGFYPARKAAHLDPIDALRYE